VDTVDSGDRRAALLQVNAARRHLRYAGIMYKPDSMHDQAQLQASTRRLQRSAHAMYGQLHSVAATRALILAARALLADTPVYPWAPGRDGPHEAA
jgi:ABC-type lipoprotein export system ATPase subunit